MAPVSRRQLQHDPTRLGGPCRRCGLKYTEKAAHVPCFEEGDTYGSWLARLSDGARVLAAPALASRTRTVFYDGWATSARNGGLAEAQISSCIAAFVQEMQALLKGECPKCGAPSTRYVDGPQQGASAVPGVWVKYRCSTQPPPGERRPDGVCDFMMDLKEVIR